MNANGETFTPVCHTRCNPGSFRRLAQAAKDTLHTPIALAELKRRAWQFVADAYEAGAL